MQENTKKINAVHLKIAWIAGAAAAIGSFIATYFQ